METFIIAAIIGVIIGIFSGLLGIGGGTLMVPIFRLGFGMSAISSTATSLFTIIPTSLAGLITHVKNKTCIPKVGVLCGLGGACTSPLGVYLASISPSWAIMLAAAAIIGYSSYSMFRKAIRMPKIAPQGESAVTGKDLEKEAEKAARAAQAAQAQAAQAAQAAAAQGKGQPTTTKAAANATKTASAPKEEPFKLSIKKVALCLLIGLIVDGIMEKRK